MNLTSKKKIFYNHKYVQYDPRKRDLIPKLCCNNQFYPFLFTSQMRTGMLFPGKIYNNL